MAAKTMLDVAKEQGTLDNIKEPEGFKEIEWQNPLANEGDQVSGLYIGKGSTIINKKAVNTYRLEQPDGSICVIRGVHQIDASMEQAEIGRHEVWFLRGKEIKSGQGKVTLYRFAIKPVEPV